MVTRYPVDDDDFPSYSPAACSYSVHLFVHRSPLRRPTSHPRLFSAQEIPSCSAISAYRNAVMALGNQRIPLLLVRVGGYRVRRDCKLGDDIAGSVVDGGTWDRLPYV
jgi:hypothetical protein